MVLVIGAFSRVDKLSRSNNHERILLWTSSYHMWKDHKIIGIGLANWKVAYEKEYILPEVKEHDLTMPHNVFMIFLSQTGIIGILDYFIF
ncbi:O-antigen ligase family protein [Mitsuokella multacida]|uniref:O-antigen ligase family protein n=1 Tax=Mitsuokella multacida TaxID=52226 RepID=UPI003F62C772